MGNNYCLKELDIKFTRKTNNWEPTFEIMVPLSAWTCRNLGVLANAQTRRVQSDVQSGRYSAPISNACDRSVLLSGFTNPDSTKTTPSCPEIQNHHRYTCMQNSIHLNVEWSIDRVPKVWRNQALSEPSERCLHVSSCLNRPLPLQKNPSKKGGFFWTLEK